MVELNGHGAQATTTQPATGGTRRAWEIGAGAAFILAAAVVIWESLRLGAGYTAAGPQSGFFPFWVAVPMLVTAAIALWHGFQVETSPRLFESSDEVHELLKVGIPLALAVLSMPWLGFYLATAAYVGFFTSWYGRYRLWAVAASMVLSPAIMYAVFERAFTLSLPKSVLYGPVFPI